MKRGWIGTPACGISVFMVGHVMGDVIWVDGVYDIYKWIRILSLSFWQQCSCSLCKQQHLNSTTTTRNETGFISTFLLSCKNTKKMHVFNSILSVFRSVVSLCLRPCSSDISRQTQTSSCNGQKPLCLNVQSLLYCWAKTPTAFFQHHTVSYPPQTAPYESCHVTLLWPIKCTNSLIFKLAFERHPSLECAI